MGRERQKLPKERLPVGAHDTLPDGSPVGQDRGQARRQGSKGFAKRGEENFLMVGPFSGTYIQYLVTWAAVPLAAADVIAIASCLDGVVIC